MYIIVVNQKEMVVNQLLKNGFKVILLQKSEKYSQNLLNSVYELQTYQLIDEVDCSKFLSSNIEIKYCLAMNDNNDLSSQQNIEDAAILSRKLMISSPCQLKHTPLFFNKYYMRKVLNLMDFSEIKYFTVTDSMKAVIPEGKFVLKDISNLNKSLSIVEIKEETIFKIDKNKILEEYISGEKFCINLSIKDDNINILKISSQNSGLQLIPTNILNKIKSDLSTFLKRMDYNDGFFNISLSVSEDGYEFLDFDLQVDPTFTVYNDESSFEKIIEKVAQIASKDNYRPNQIDPLVQHGRVPRGRI